MSTSMKIPVFCDPCAKLVAVEADPDGQATCPDCGAVLQIPSTCDVFISYATPDLAKAELVGAELLEAGISYWLAPYQIGMGDSFLESIDQALAGAKVVVLILSSSSVQSPWVRREITESISNHRPVLPLRIEDFELPREWKILLSHNQWEDAFRKAFEEHVADLVGRVEAELRKAAARAKTATAPIQPSPPIEQAPLLGVNPDVSPFVGPRPFPSLMANKFFGRQHEAEALLRSIGNSRVVLVYAPSGAGKSSLINTLITQSLEEQGHEVFLGARVGGALPENVPSSKIDNIFSFSAIYGLDTTTAPSPRGRLSDYLDSIRRKPGTRGRVLVFDQFEELFTQHAERFEDRKGFFEDLTHALNRDPSLRVLVAMRQEYLADIDPLTASLPEDLSMQRFALRRLGTSGALEAITRPVAPYAEFGPGVAEELVRQLNTITVPGFDGVLVEKRGEFIEMVHLQIVCERLWSNLPPGITRIEREHVEGAAGEGKSFTEFVVDALNAFYADTVAKVATSRTTQAHGGYSKELIQLGCMKFVTPASTRTMVQRRHGRTGRLPDWIVDQLEKSHLLRVEQRGGERWYELSHDRLAEPVGRQMDRDVGRLLYAADLLDKVMEKVLEEHEGSLHGYFGEHRDVLAECEPFHGQVGLFPDEAEFVFRSSLVVGQDVIAWSRRLQTDYPEIRAKVLADALKAPRPSVRRNAASLLGKEPQTELLPLLAPLAMDDPEASVRHAAARSLARLDRPDLLTPLIDGLKNSDTHLRSTRALSRIRIVVDAREPAPAFEAVFAGLSRPDQGRIRRTARRMRLGEGLADVAFVVIPAAVLGALAAAAFKWLPATFSWSLSQANANPAMGIFHGLTAGIVWAGFIVLGLTVYRVVYGRDGGPRSYVQPLGALGVGAACGLVSSALVILIIVSVYEVASLHVMGWLTENVVSAERFTRIFWRDLFVETRFGWPYLITGTGLGVGMALATNALQASPRWTDFLNQQTRLTGMKQTMGLILAMSRLALRQAWPIPVMLILTGLLAYTVPVVPHEYPSKASSELLALGLLGDCATKAIGGFFAIVGMGLGVVMMRYGVQVEGRRHWQ